MTRSTLKDGKKSENAARNGLKNSRVKPARGSAKSTFDPEKVGV
jgi:hypothetical protein